jgi:hypothetical protein
MRIALRSSDPAFSYTFSPESCREYSSVIWRAAVARQTESCSSVLMTSDFRVGTMMEEEKEEEMMGIARTNNSLSFALNDAFRRVFGPSEPSQTWLLAIDGPDLTPESFYATPLPLPATTGESRSFYQAKFTCTEKETSGRRQKVRINLVTKEFRSLGRSFSIAGTSPSTILATNLFSGWRIEYWDGSIYHHPQSRPLNANPESDLYFSTPDDFRDSVKAGFAAGTMHCP